MTGSVPEPAERHLCRTCDPSLPVQPGEIIKTAREWDAEGLGRGVFRATLLDRIAAWLVCGECFRLRGGPGHLLTRWAHS